MNLKLLGATLQRIRTQKKITQLQMAQSLNVSKSLVSKMENGKARMPVSVLVDYCITLGLPVSEMLSEIERIPRS